MVYFDSPYIAKCYLREHGTDTVLDLAEASDDRPGRRGSAGGVS